LTYAYIPPLKITLSC